MPSTTFDPAWAVQLANMVKQAYWQYAEGVKDPQYNGKISPPSGFVQTAAFKAPEIDTGRSSKLVSAVLGRSVDLTNLAALQGHTATIRDVWFGYALAPAAGATNPVNVLVFRGTQSVEEWLEDATFAQVDVPLVWFKDGRFQIAKASVGFLLVYALLVEQVLAATRAFNSSYPLYVTGHSLGHALAVFSALTANTLVYSGGGLLGQVQMYSFAGPRVGDPVFSSAYDFFLPASFRVVNLSDVVPVAPPSSIFGYRYSHVGQEWSYLFQTGEIVGNHSLDDNYIPGVTARVETDAARAYPNSGIPG
jgi:hypothetical protein